MAKTKCAKNQPKNKRKYKARKNKMPMYKSLQSYKGGASIPQQMYVKLKYVESMTLSGAPSMQLFRGNDLFDPNYTSTGHQPYLADQLAPLYQNFTVYASKIKVRAGTDGSLDGRLLVRPTHSSATISNFDLSCERPETKSCLFTPERRCSITQYADTKRIIGVSDVSDLEYAGRNNTSGPATPPNQIWYWAISTIGADGSNISCPIEIELIYYVKFWKRTIQAQS